MEKCSFIMFITVATLALYVQGASGCKDVYSNCADFKGTWKCKVPIIKNGCTCSCGGGGAAPPPKKIVTKPKPESSGCKDIYSNCATFKGTYSCNNPTIKKGCGCSCAGGPPKPKTFANKGLNQEEIKACVKSENDFRAMHEGTSPLQWDSSLAEEAQKYANELLAMSYRNKKPKLIHEKPANDMGENLYWGDSSKAKTCIDADKKWYSEEKDYNYSTGKSKNGKAIGHFTQVVWKGTTKFGVGVASGASIKYASYGNVQTFVVAKYTPPGNYRGQYTTNVGMKIN